MTRDIAQILDKYEGQDTGTILANPSLERDIALIGQAMNDADTQTQLRARSFFETVLGQIDQTMNELKDDMRSHEENMGHMQKMSDACIAYVKQKGR